MGKISLEKGVWSAALGLGGAGAIMIWPAQALIGYGLILAAGLLALWGFRVGGMHWWQLRWRPKWPLFSQGVVYVGQVLVSDTHVEAGHYLLVHVTGFNGTSRNLQATRVTGEIAVTLHLRGPGEVIFTLPSPSLLGGTKALAAGQEFSLTVEQPMRPDQAALFQMHMKQDATAILMLEGLNVAIEGRKRGKVERLNLWDGVNFKDGRVVGRIVSMRTQATSKVEV